MARSKRRKEINEPRRLEDLDGRTAREIDFLHLAARKNGTGVRELRLHTRSLKSERSNVKFTGVSFYKVARYRIRPRVTQGLRAFSSPDTLSAYKSGMTNFGV